MDGVSLENMDKYLSDILSAKYGEEVRGSIHDAIRACSDYQREVGYLSDFDYLSRISDQIGIVYASEADFDAESASGKYYLNGVLRDTDSSWQAIPAVTVPAGEYVFSCISMRFSYYKLASNDDAFINMLSSHNNVGSNCFRIRFNEPATLFLTSYKLSRGVGGGSHPFVVSVPRNDRSELYSSDGSIDMLNHHLNYMLGGDRVLRINGEGMHVANDAPQSISETLFPGTNLEWVQNPSTPDVGYICSELIDPHGYIIFEYAIDIYNATNSMFDAMAVIEQNDGATRFVPVVRDTGSISNKTHRVVLDLNNYAVYNNAKRVGLALIGHSRDSETPTFTLKTNSFVYWTEHALDSDRYDPNIKTWLSEVDRHLSSVETSQSSDSNVLASPNGSRYRLSVSDDGVLSAVPILPSKAYYFGNSLLTGFGPFGMAADDRDSDYYALINSHIRQKNSNFKSKGKLNIAEWEGMTDVETADNWVDANVLPLIDETYDLIVIQACDNCNTDDKQAVFPETSLHLMQKVRTRCPKANVVWIASWFGQNLVDGLAKNAAATGVTLVDVRSFYGGKNNSYVGAVYSYGESENDWEVSVSSYSDDAERKTLTFTVDGASSPSVVRYSEYTDNIQSSGKLLIKGPDRVVVSSGVAMHPSTRGFKCIANKFLYETGISDVEETYPLD